MSDTWAKLLFFCLPLAAALDHSGNRCHSQRGRSVLGPSDLEPVLASRARARDRVLADRNLWVGGTEASPRSRFLTTARVIANAVLRFVVYRIAPLKTASPRKVRCAPCLSPEITSRISCGDHRRVGRRAKYENARIAGRTTRSCRSRWRRAARAKASVDGRLHSPSGGPTTCGMPFGHRARGRSREQNCSTILSSSLNFTPMSPD